MRKLVTTFALLASSLAASPGHANENGVMSFRLEDPCRGSGSACHSVIVAEGVIGPSTPDRFREFLKEAGDAPYLDVYLNSPGGSLAAGIELGREIRARGLNTVVRREFYTLDDGTDGPDYADGRCESACIYAFAGGVSRQADDRTLGVHQFSYGRAADHQVESTQAIVTVLGIYLEEQGVSRTLLDIASITPPGSIFPLTRDAARQMNLDNSSPERASWKLIAETNEIDRLTALLTIAQRVPGTDQQGVLEIEPLRDGISARILVRAPITAGRASQDDAIDASRLSQFSLCGVRGQPCIKLDSTATQGMEKSALELRATAAIEQISRLIEPEGNLYLSVDTANYSSGFFPAFGVTTLDLAALLEVARRANIRDR